MDNQKTLDKLINSNIRVVNTDEIPHPSSVIDIMKEFGDIKMAKLSGKIDGLDDDLNEIQLINNYLIEVQVNDKDEFFGTLGLIVQQGSSKVKIYSGLTAHACLNLSVWGADYVKDLKGIEIELLKGFLDKGYKNLNKQTDVILSNVDRLKNSIYFKDEWTMKKGNLLEIMNPSLFGYLTNAEELLRDEKSLYYDQPLTDWTLLSALTHKISTEGISSRVNKTLKLEALFV
jgi:hypothetical protein